MFSFFKSLAGQAKPAHSFPPLRFHNTLSGKTEVFEPINHTVKMYNCGPTAYDEQHVGNLFPPVIANIVHRTLDVWGYKTKEVNNITDFGHISEDEDSEDKMTKGLRREGLTPTLTNMRALAEKYTELFLKDLPPLGVDPAKVIYPRASDYIHAQIELIKTLEQKSYAYRTGDGVYFDISKFSEYGKLGNLNLAGQVTGSRVELNPEKKGPYDFALWKLDSKLGWQSPWGLGFPGWHTECVAMIFSVLGKQIDIHMGGNDLIAVHHNNEIAQAEAASGKKPFVRYWLHNAHITIDGKKISKSVGNTVYLHNIADKGFSPRALRYWFLTGHYRTPMNFTWGALEGADTALIRLRRFFLELPQSRAEPDPAFVKDFYTAIATDLNTAQALARVWNLVKDNTVAPGVKRASLVEADRVLGLGLNEPREVLKINVQEDVAAEDLPPEIKALVAQREEARKNKNFTSADLLRDKIEQMGYQLKDTPGGPEIGLK